MLAELIATDGVVEDLVLGSPVGVMALHGGLESSTASAAARCARLTGASLYTVVQPADFRWHVPSIRFDPAQSRNLSAFLDRVRVAVSFHGFGRRGLEGSVLIGGRNARLRRSIGDAIRRATGLRAVSDPRAIPESLRGLHPRNPVNLPELGGVQLELSPQARADGRLELLVDAVAGVLSGEQQGLCPRPAAAPARRPV